MYERGSLTLLGTVAMGTGVMIGAGIFALTGQVAQLSGSWFPLAFLVAAIVSGFSAYSYIKVSNKYPSAGGIAMILEKAYGPTTVTGGAALLMAFSMIINESLVARTFGTYALQLFEVDSGGPLVSLLAVSLIVAALLVNLAGNKAIGGISKLTAAAKVGGILLFAGLALWVSGIRLDPLAVDPGGRASPGGFLAGVALAILAFKGFTTITNSGGEVVDPKRNVGRAIILSLVICLLVYLLVALAVASSLTTDEIVAARDYVLAEAARPSIGEAGLVFTVIIAIVATASGLLASMFAVSRMLAMLTEMRLIPHRHFGMAGTVQNHTLIYTAIAAGLLAAFFDLGRIAALGAIFYLVMDIVIHWGVFRTLRREVGAHGGILLAAMLFDAVALAAFLIAKIQGDMLIVGLALGGIAVTFLMERVYLRPRRKPLQSGHPTHGEEP